MSNLNNLLLKLCEADIEFVIVGGFAAVIHGSSMLTRDLDVCVVLSPANISRLRHVFKELHPVHRFNPQRISFLDDPANDTPLKNLYLQTDLGPIDLLGEIKGLGTFEEVVKNAEEISLFGKKVYLISLEDLIKSKQAMGREKDLITVKELLAINKKNNSQT